MTETNVAAPETTTAPQNATVAPETPHEDPLAFLRDPGLKAKVAALEAEKAALQKKTEEEIVSGLKARYALAKVECDGIEEYLEELGYPLEEEETPPVQKARGVEGSSLTLAQGVEKLCKEHKGGLSKAQIVDLMQTEIGYKFGTSDPTGIYNSVYTGGINKLVRDGTIIPVGPRGQTMYIHKDYMAPHGE